MACARRAAARLRAFHPQVEISAAPLAARAAGDKALCHDDALAIRAESTGPSPRSTCPTGSGPSRTITHPPRWLSTDLRDGNQAIVDPMDAVKKNRFFDLLVEIGVKEIEIGFPAAGQTEFDFIQGLVRSGTIPDDVIVQVLTQAREDLIRRSFESLEGARAAIVHVYNALSPAWREIVFRMTPRRSASRSRSTRAKLLRDEAAKRPETDWHFEYSPETFSTAELDFSLEICEAVMDVLQPTARAAADPQPAGDGRGGDAQRLRRPDRVLLPQPAQPRGARASACTRTTTAAPASPRPSSG